VQPAPVIPIVEPPAPIAIKRDGGAQYKELEEAFPHHNGANFLFPTDLVVNPLKLRRVAIIGSCFMQAFKYQQTNPSGCEADLFVANNAADLPVWPGTDDDPAPYDFQIIQIGLRFVVPDQIWRIPYSQPARYQEEYDSSIKRLAFQLQRRMTWNEAHGLVTFVTNFNLPQRSPMGALFPRHDLRNPEYFIQRVNEELERLVFTYRNAYVLDMDRVSASFGRRYLQDDVLAPISHGSVAGFAPQIGNRIEPIPPTTNHFPLTWNKEFTAAIWNEAVGMMRTLRGIDAVKMVVLDLDDTLWSGVIGEMEKPGPDILAPWQNALIEALVLLKHRGILLAILSKNEESRIRELWSGVFGNRISLDDFAVVQISWQPKPEGMRAILAGANLLPRNVVFIDDNPAERDAIKRAFPDLRVLGRHPYYLRHTLMWSAETQVATLTEEGARRTEMIQAQVRRETDRTAISEDEFLAAASPVVSTAIVRRVADARFARTQELVGKTNQFNTTGQRWTPPEWAAFFARGGYALTFDVTDAYTEYGLVGVLLVEGATIVQFVMSCRVLGYRIEQAVLARLVATMREAGAGEITARLVETDANFPCREVYAKAGFEKFGSGWRLAPGGSVAAPLHVRVG
jgi:FkbH-like protein